MFDIKKILLEKITKKFLPLIPKKGPEFELMFIKYLNSFELNPDFGETRVIATIFPDTQGKISMSIMSMNDQNTIVRALKTITMEEVYVLLSNPNILEDKEVKKMIEDFNI